MRAALGGSVHVLAVAFFLALASLAGPSGARADIPPPPGYVESCTAAIQASAAEVCVECSTYHAEPMACVEQLAPQGLTKRCQSRGASSWTEVWCRPRTEADGPAPAPSPTPASAPTAASAPTPAPAPAAASPERGSGCAAGRGRSGARALAIAAAALALTLLRRRR